MREFFAQLPDDSRREFLAAAPDNDGDGVPDLLQWHDDQGSLDASVTTTQTPSGAVRTVVTVNGVTYDSPDQVPPQIAEQLRRAGLALPHTTGPAPRRAAPPGPAGSWSDPDPVRDQWTPRRAGPAPAVQPGPSAQPAPSTQPSHAFAPAGSTGPAHGQGSPSWGSATPARAQPVSPSLASISDQSELTRQMLGEAPPRKWWQFWKR